MISALAEEEEQSPKDHFSNEDEVKLESDDDGDMSEHHDSSMISKTVSEVDS